MIKDVTSGIGKHCFHHFKCQTALVTDVQMDSGFLNVNFFYFVNIFSLGMTPRGTTHSLVIYSLKHL